MSIDFLMLTLAVPTCYHANLVSRFVEIPHLIYRAHALSLESRVQFAGDAARLVPIFGVRGANSMAPPSFAFKLMRQAVLSLAVKHSGSAH
jgi:hypothetical protein